MHKTFITKILTYAPKIDNTPQNEYTKSVLIRYCCVNLIRTDKNEYEPIIETEINTLVDKWIDTVIPYVVESIGG